MNITAEVVFEDERYPLLILDIDGQKSGHALNLGTLEFRRVCLCNAHEPNECMCGAWNSDEYLDN